MTTNQLRIRKVDSTHFQIPCPIPSQSEAIGADIRADLEYAIGLMNNFPPEQRTLTLFLCLIKNSEARAALAVLAGVK